MKLIQSKLFISSVSFVVGIAAVLLGQKYLYRPKQKLEIVPLTQSANKMNSLLDQFYDDDFFGSVHDPFEQMRKMRKRMMKDFNAFENNEGFFDSWYSKRFGGGHAGEVTQREDKDYIYYDLAIKDLNKEKVNVRVENGQISLSGQIEKKTIENGSETFFSSSFHRTFPAPMEVDAKRVQIDSSEDKLTLKFPKTHKPTSN